MTGDHLEAILKNANAKSEKDGYSTLAEGGALTLYVAHNGASLSIARVDRIKVDGEMVFARTVKKEVYTVLLADVYAVSVEGTVGQPARRAGFG